MTSPPHVVVLTWPPGDFGRVLDLDVHDLRGPGAAVDVVRGADVVAHVLRTDLEDYGRALTSLVSHTSKI